jgi:hypothetical protein
MSLSAISSTACPAHPASSTRCTSTAPSSGRKNMAAGRKAHVIRRQKARTSLRLKHHGIVKVPLHAPRGSLGAAWPVLSAIFSCVRSVRPNPHRFLPSCHHHHHRQPQRRLILLSAFQLHLHQASSRLSVCAAVCDIYPILPCIPSASTRPQALLARNKQSLLTRPPAPSTTTSVVRYSSLASLIARTVHLDICLATSSSQIHFQSRPSS